VLFPGLRMRMNGHVMGTGITRCTMCDVRLSSKAIENHVGDTGFLLVFGWAVRRRWMVMRTGVGVGCPVPACSSIGSASPCYRFAGCMMLRLYSTIHVYNKDCRAETDRGCDGRYNWIVRQSLLPVEIVRRPQTASPLARGVCHIIAMQALYTSFPSSTRSRTS